MGTWWRVEPETNPRSGHQRVAKGVLLVKELHFDIFHKHAARLRMANIAQTVNVLQAMILTDEDGGVVRTPSFHVFEMNKSHQDARQLPVHLIEQPAAHVADVSVPLKAPLREVPRLPVIVVPLEEEPGHAC